MKLEKIRFKVKDEKFKLTGFQMCFSDGIESELYEEEYYKKDGFLTQEAVISAEIKKIRQISVKRANELTCGLRLIDEEGKNILDVTFFTEYEIGQWITQDIPEG